MKNEEWPGAATRTQQTAERSVGFSGGVGRAGGGTLPWPAGGTPPFTSTASRSLPTHVTDVT